MKKIGDYFAALIGALIVAFGSLIVGFILLLLSPIIASILLEEDKLSQYNDNKEGGTNGAQRRIN